MVAYSLSFCDYIGMINSVLALINKVALFATFTVNKLKKSLINEDGRTNNTRRLMDGYMHG